MTFQLLDATAAGYTGLRSEGVTTSSRADVTKAIVTVKIYQSGQLIGTYTPALTNMWGGVGQASFTFVPPRAGTYTAVAYSSPGSYFFFDPLNWTVPVR